MSVEDEKTIDFVGIGKETGEVVLTISDHLPWTDSSEENRKHLNLLEAKINTYLQFIENGQLVEDYPDARDKKVIIKVMGQYALNYDGISYYKKAEQVIVNAGYRLSFELFVNNT